MSPFIIFLLFASIYSKPAWQCGTQSAFTCAPTQTCCRGPAGYTCYPTENGVCCSDGNSACPQGTTCNMREKRCDKSSMTFLEENTIEFLSIEADLVLIGESAVEFAEGLFEGFELFNNLPHQSQCVTDAFQDIIDIVNLIKNVSIHSDYKQLVSDLINKTTDAFKRTEGCRKWGKELEETVNQMKNTLTDFTYLPSLAYHTATNIGTITEKVTNSAKLFANGKFRKSGNGFGDLIKYVLFYSQQS